MRFSLFLDQNHPKSEATNFNKKFRQIQTLSLKLVRDNSLKTGGFLSQIRDPVWTKLTRPQTQPADSDSGTEACKHPTGLDIHISNTRVNGT